MTTASETAFFQHFYRRVEVLVAEFKATPHAAMAIDRFERSGASHSEWAGAGSRLVNPPTPIWPGVGESLMSPAELEALTG